MQPMVRPPREPVLFTILRCLLPSHKHFLAEVKRVLGPLLACLLRKIGKPRSQRLLSNRIHQKGMPFANGLASPLKPRSGALVVATRKCALASTQSAGGPYERTAV